MLPDHVIILILQKSYNYAKTEHIYVLFGQGLPPHLLTEVTTWQAGVSEQGADSRAGDPPAPSALGHPLSCWSERTFTQDMITYFLKQI